MVRDFHAVLFEHVDVVEDDVGLVDADRHHVVVAVRRGAHINQAGDQAVFNFAVFPHAVQVQQQVGGQVGLDFLAGMGLERLRALARLGQHLDLHNHRAAGAAGDGVGFGVRILVGIAEFRDDALDGVLFAAGGPPVIDVHGAFGLGIVNDRFEIQVIRVDLGVLGCQRARAGYRQEQGQQQGNQFFHLPVPPLL